MKRKISSLALALVLCLSLCAPAFAADASAPSPRSHVFISQSYSGSFAQAWEKTYSASAEDGSGSYPMSITYGYNTVLVNEDYCWAYCDDYAHWAGLTNGNGSHQGGIALPGWASKIEVTHSGTRVTYSCNIN